MRQQYLPLILLAILAVFGASGCGILNPQTPTPVPYATHSAQDVFDAYARAGLQIQNLEKNMSVDGRGAPSGFSDRYIFEIPSVAPNGGQVIVFASPDQAQAWQSYIESLRNKSDSRRDVVYVYFKDNLMLQLSASLTNQEASAYRDAFNGLS